MRRKTNEEFLADLYRVHGDEYTPLEPYIKSNIPIKVRHNNCGNIYTTTPNRLSRSGCPQCFGNFAKKKDTKTFSREVFELVGNEYTVVGEYVNRATPIDIVHNKCGTLCKISAGNFLCGTRCAKCAKDSLRLTKEEAEHRMQETIGTDFRIVGEYANMQTKVAVLHETCGNISHIRLTDVVYKGVSCKYCNMPNGEKLVKSVLTQLGLSFEMQKTFDDLKNINKLSYDFYVPSKELLIEYQGEQHFKCKNFGGMSKEKAQIKFELQQINDELKREYAKAKGFKLIEVPYTVKTLSDVKKFLEENIK